MPNMLINALTGTPSAPTVTFAAPNLTGVPVMRGRRALSDSVLKAYEADPMTAAVKGLDTLATDSSPARGGWGEGLARVLAGVAGGYFGNKNDEVYQERQKNRDDALQKALMGQDPDAMLNELSANPDTADIAMGIRQKQMEKRAEMEAQANAPLTPWQRAQLQSENITDTAGNIIPKYRQDVVAQFMGGSAPNQVAGISPENGGGGMLPAPANMAASMPQQVGGGAYGPQPGVAPKAVVAGQEQVQKNLANVAAPEAGKNDVETLTNTLNMLQEAKILNDQAYGGMLAGPTTQMVGRILGDDALSAHQRERRDAYTQMEQKLQAIAAEATKPLFGSSQLSDADRIAAQKAASVPPTASQQERAAALDQIVAIIQRKRDLAALNQAAAQQGRAVSPQEVQAYYASKGIDYASGAPLTKTQLAGTTAPVTGTTMEGGVELLPPPSGKGAPDMSLLTQAAGTAPAPAAVGAVPTPAGTIATPKTEAEYNALPSGTRFTAPDGTTRVKP